MNASENLNSHSFESEPLSEKDSDSDLEKRIVIQGVPGAFHHIAARRFFNTAVTEYNNALEMFPSNIVAKMVGYRLKNVFVATAEERQNVDVEQIFSN